MKLDAFSSPVRPLLTGPKGAVAAADPLAVSAGLDMLARGGSAADALIAAQAVICVVAPDAAGLGGDGFVLHAGTDGTVGAINASGPSPAAATAAASTGGASVAVPGMVDGWLTLHQGHGRRPLGECLAPAIGYARGGVRVPSSLVAARDAQAGRLRAGGADCWPLIDLAAGARWTQPELAAVLEAIGDTGREALYGGRIGRAIAAAVQRHGGAMEEDDLAAPVAVRPQPIAIEAFGARVTVQPPVSQGVLLAMALKALAAAAPADADLDHALIELTLAAFGHRDAVPRGAALLDARLDHDPARASNRAGPRSYLHTAGVCAADAEGNVASSLVSVFDDFGSAVFVPEGGFVLNNRIGGFTAGDNAFAPNRRPVHTLAPIIVERDRTVLALSTPGADGQVQSLLQVLAGWLVRGHDLAEAVAAPRWRSEDGRLLVERGHPASAALAERGHAVDEIAPGDMRFGSVTVAGRHDGAPLTLADWRRQSWAGVV